MAIYEATTPSVETKSQPKNIGVTMAVLFKLGSSLMKVGKSLKFILAAGSFATYSFLFTWKFAILIMFGIGIHEIGHVWAMRKSGMKTKGFYFIPLIGGAAVPDDDFKTGKQEIFIALMGPVFGILTMGPPLFLYMVTKEPMWAAAASWLATINLFNLFPVNPLDGGRVTKSIAFSLHNKIGYGFLAVTFLLGAYFAWVSGLSLLWFIMLMGMIEIPPILAAFFFPIYVISHLVLTIAVWFRRESVKEHLQKTFYHYSIYFSHKIEMWELRNKPGKWELSSKDKLKYIGWYIGMIILFLYTIFILADIPGADVSVQFLES